MVTERLHENKVEDQQVVRSSVYLHMKVILAKSSEKFKTPVKEL